MKTDRVNYLVVGSFVIAMLVALVVGLAVLAGRTGPTDTYYTTFRDVSGIELGTQVLYMGYPVGQVESIRPVRAEGDLRFRVRMSVKQGWKVPRDSVAKISASGLLSAITVDIRAGESSKFLEPGDQIEGQDTATLFAAVSDTADTVRDLAENSLRPLLVDLNRYLDSFGRLVEKDAREIMRDLDSVSSALASDAPGIIDNFRDASERLQKSSVQLQQLIGAENVERVGSTLENVERMSAQLSDASEKLRASSDELNEMLGPQSTAKVHGVLDDLARAASNVAQLTSDLEGTRTQLDRLLGSLAEVVGDKRSEIGESISHLRHILATISQSINAVTYNLEGTTRNLHELSRELRRNPGLLLRATPPADEARGAAQ